MDSHRARLALDFDALPRQVVERLAVPLQGRKHRRNLADRTAETHQRQLEFAWPDVDRTLLDDAAIGITGIGRDAEQEIGFVGLVSGEQIDGKEPPVTDFVDVVVDVIATAARRYTTGAPTV